MRRGIVDVVSMMLVLCVTPWDESVIASPTSVEHALCEVYASVLSGIPLFQPHGMRLVIFSESTVDPTTEYYRDAERRARDLQDGIVSPGDLDPESLALLSCWNPTGGAPGTMTRDEAEQSARGTQLYDDEHIVETVEEGPAAIDRMKKETEEKLPGIDAAVFEAYQIANTRSTELTLDSCRDVPHTLLHITAEEESVIFGSCGWWREFYERFPGTAGITRLSIPGFDATGMHALLYVSRTWGGLQSEGYFVGLEKKGERWIIVGTVLRAVS